MCLFVCAPGKHICLDYVSELITLLKDGTSEVVVDALVCNKSDTEIDSLLLIYPNTFMHVFRDFQGDQILADFEDWRVEDLSKTFLDPNSDYNWFYKAVGCDLHQNSHNQSTSDLLLTLSLPDPIDPADRDKDIKYNGTVADGSYLALLEDLDAFDYRILDQVRFCPFEVTLYQHPLVPGDTRWFRWKFHGRASALNRITRRRSFLSQKMTNSQYFLYEMWGPFDTRDRLRTFLKGMLREDAYRMDGGQSDEWASMMKLRARALLNKIYNEGADKEGTRTDIPDWRIRVEPSRVGERLTDPVYDGHVAPAGGLSNLRKRDDFFVPYYEWKSGSRMEVDNPITIERNCGDDDTPFEYHFRISFQAKPPFWPILWLPWIGFVLALVSLFLGIASILLAKDN